GTSSPRNGRTFYRKAQNASSRAAGRLLPCASPSLDADLQVVHRGARLHSDVPAPAGAEVVGHRDGQPPAALTGRLERVVLEVGLLRVDGGVVVARAVGRTEDDDGAMQPSSPPVQS